MQISPWYLILCYKKIFLKVCFGDEICTQFTISVQLQIGIMVINVKSLAVKVFVGVNAPLHTMSCVILISKG